VFFEFTVVRYEFFVGFVYIRGKFPALKFDYQQYNFIAFWFAPSL